MLNRWEGIGNLGKDPETRYTTGSNPTAVCRFSIAVEKGYGENKKTVWVNIVTFGKLAENCQKFLQKGRKVYAAGELDVREYDKQDGTRGYITEVVANTIEFLSSREQDNWPPQNSGVVNTQPVQNPNVSQYTQQSSTYYTQQQPVSVPVSAPVQQTPAPQQQFITREQYEAEKAQQPPAGFTALADDDIPF